MDKYGTHNGITCDGCGCSPIQGFRHKCKNCKNHDLCDDCHTAFTNGELRQNPNLARVNKVSQNIEDHVFDKYCEADGSFVRLGGTKSVLATPKGEKKTKPNEPCPCESGKKYKKCCGK